MICLSLRTKINTMSGSEGDIKCIVVLKDIKACSSFMKGRLHTKTCLLICADWEITLQTFETSSNMLLTLFMDRWLSENIYGLLEMTEKSVGGKNVRCTTSNLYEAKRKPRLVKWNYFKLAFMFQFSRTRQPGYLLRP